MTDQLPRYGELATPEEQRRAAGLPPLAETAPVPEAPAATEPASAPSSAPAGRNRADRFATIALLAYGLVNVITTGLAYLDLPTVMDENMKVLGIEGEFTNFAQGRLWGTIAAIVLAVGWSVTAAMSVRRLRRNRLTWWVPVVGAAVTLLVVSLCVAVPMVGDPAFIGHVEQMVGV